VSDLSKLRAEVEALRDEADNDANAPYAPSKFAQSRSGMVLAYGRVLDLIDKHAREGQ
jgi:hypothetical protein